MKIIGCFSQLQMGKTTVADFLANELKWNKAAFAAQVKNIFCDTFNVDKEFIEKWKVNKEPPEGFDKNIRQSLQFIGDGFRTIQEDVWVDSCFRNNKPPMIIEDGRYFSELKKIRSLGGINLLIYRPGFLNDDPNGSEAGIRPVIDFFLNLNKEGDMLDSIMTSIVSLETTPPGVPYIDFFLKNEGTKEELYQKINDVFIPYVKNRCCENGSCCCKKK